MRRALRALLGPRAYGWLGARWVWAKTALNYALMRLPLVGARASAWPHALYVEGTNICNAACVFCAYPQMERPKLVMPLELFRSVVDQYVAAGGREIDLTPIVGDPFADAKLFERLDYVAAKPGVRRFHFFTNAIAMRPELGERLLAYGPRLTVHVSFGGFDRETYLKVFAVDKFDVVVANLRAFLAAKRARASASAGLQLNLRTPRGNNQGPFWEELVGAQREGLLSLTWMSAYDSWTGIIPESALTNVGLEARPMPRKVGACHRLLTSPVVLADGRVNACACRDVEAALIVGDAKTEPLADILRGKALHDLLDRHARGDFPDVCRRCTYYDSVWPAWVTGNREPDASGPVS